MSDFLEVLSRKSLKRHRNEDYAKRKVQIKKYKDEKNLQKLEKNIMKKKTIVEEKTKETKCEVDDDTVDTTSGRDYTISIALPGSILDNAQSPELRTYLAGQIARACVIFQVDEIIIFDENDDKDGKLSVEGEFRGVGKKGDGCVQLARILQYLECPQYMRKSLFPKHRDLQYAGLLNPLDSPHHMRMEDEVPYREGVVLSKPIKDGKGSFVDCGALKVVQIDKKLETNVRVTVKMLKSHKERPKHYHGKAVPPTEPRLNRGIYWGYSVRLASSLSGVFTDCSVGGKYDVTIGTSERGESVDDFTMPRFKHLLVVFGGLKGLEASLAADKDLDGIEDPSLLFQHYLNTCPIQGSRTIRTEEAILITMSSLRPKIERNKSHSSYIVLLIEVVAREPPSFPAACQCS